MIKIHSPIIDRSIMIPLSKSKQALHLLYLVDESHDLLYGMLLSITFIILYKDPRSHKSNSTLILLNTLCCNIFYTN